MLTLYKQELSAAKLGVAPRLALKVFATQTQALQAVGETGKASQDCAQCVSFQLAIGLRRSLFANTT